ncbi:hypothetical protein [Cypionkella sinensis]|uniref:Uncharacterized protein n=1 Tax=Cypionkella sinensis TaxID=1756043 RepID=A0ABV7IYF8_9RHOB
MPKLAILAAVAGLVIALPAVGTSQPAIPISECEYSQSYGPDTYYEDHADLGGGFIMYAERSKHAFNVLAVDCFSGATLRIDHGSDDQKANMNVQKSIEKSIVNSARSSERVTLSALKKQFSSRGIWTELSVSNVEHCACAAFYPEAKGEKEDWEVRLNHP